MTERLPPGFVLDPVKPLARGLKGVAVADSKTPHAAAKKNSALKGVAESAPPESVGPAPEGMLARAGWADRQGFQGMLGGLRAGCADAPWTALLQDAAHGASYRPVDENCARSYPDYVTPHPPVKRFSNARGWRDMETDWKQDEQRQVVRQGEKIFKDNGAPLYEVGPAVTPGQNNFDALIVKSLKRYPSIDPLIYKSLLFQESKMKLLSAHRTSRYAGIAQLGPTEAVSEGGLSMGATKFKNGKWTYDKEGDQRFNPEKALPVAAQVLDMKMREIDRFLKERGISDQYSEEERWPLYLAAYNAGQGTVTGIMNLAIQEGINAPKWDQLIAGEPKNSFLWRGMKFKDREGKYKEIKKYPEEILARYME
ncbi:transglycosylase SLT domain-containing protein [Solimonas sp. SE-A11]|uniref:transglycosylase SLT domain-containing protein n=1 Tax=Solimonas sp. SE-A11 TaxID=3054954 RepID=UPI00259CA3E2|nr:transglycosylase SLT domain-containing protein [Solimonas sp. SE-A11]MDM4773051.1 transglycosylase SLT domain-containing protein [Solimonas sp. SE-A11]